MSVLVVVSKRMQQLPTMLTHLQYRRKDTTCKTSTLLRYASSITKQKKFWELLAQKFDRFQTLRNNTQQHATRCANGRKM